MSTLDLSPLPGAASTWRMIISQALFEFRTTLRNPEQLLLTLVIPLVLLVALVAANIVSLGEGRRVDLVTPGILALAVMSTAFTGLAISTGFNRRYGALRFLGTTPLSRSALVVATFIAVLLTEAVQVVLISLVALLLGWQPQGSWLMAIALLIAGTAAFSTWAIALAGVLRAEATLAVANAIYLILLLGGAVVIPASRMPATWGSIASILPSGALAQGLRSVLIDGASAFGALGVLAAWAITGGIVAARTFRWE
jgi:ABC-2 type transport system permease protein